jgi:hypothetical protein
MFRRYCTKKFFNILFLIFFFRNISTKISIKLAEFVLNVVNMNISKMEYVIVLMVKNFLIHSLILFHFNINLFLLYK